MISHSNADYTTVNANFEDHCNFQASTPIHEQELNNFQTADFSLTCVNAADIGNSLFNTIHSFRWYGTGYSGKGIS